MSAHETHDERVDMKYEQAKRRAVVAWGVVGIIAVVLLALRGLALIWPAVRLILVGCIVGFMCSPLTNRLEDRGFSRGLAAFLSLLLIIGVVTAAALLLGGPLVEQILVLLRTIPAYFAQAQAAITEFWSEYGSTQTASVQITVNQVFSSLSSMGTSLAGDLARTISSGLVSNISSLISAFVTFFLGLILAFWLAKDYPTIVQELGAIAGPDRSQDMTLMLAVLSRSMGGYMRGAVVTAIANGVLSYLGFAMLGHPFAGLMGIATGVLHVVPVVGPIISGVAAVALALFSSPMLAVWTLVVTVVATNITGNLIQPLVMQSAVKIHPVLSLVGIIVGSALGGALGMVVAIPLTAAIRGVFVYYYETKTGRQIVSYDGALFRSTPYYDMEGNILPTYDALDDDKFFLNTRLIAREAAPDAEAGQRPEGMRRTIADLVVTAADDFTSTHLERVTPQDLSQDQTDVAETGQDQDS